MECGYHIERGYFCADSGGVEFGGGLPKKLYVVYEGSDNGGHVHPDLHPFRGVFLIGLLPLQFQSEFCLLLWHMWFHVHMDDNNNSGHSNPLDSQPDIEIKEIVVRGDVYVELDEKDKHEGEYGEDFDDI